MSAVDDLLERAREGWTRLSAAEAYAAQQAGALLVDTRTAAQRAGTGELPGALVVNRTVLEWRLGRVSRVPMSGGAVSAPGPARRRSESAAGCAERGQRRRSGCGAAPAPIGVERHDPDPTSPVRIPEAAARPRIVVVCRQGYSSSLAARSLRDLGLDATDVVDGVEGWVAAGLPLVSGPADVRE